VPQFSAGTRLHGRFAIGQGLIVTAMELAPRNNAKPRETNLYAP
jgi:hypothetical protein